MDLGTKSDTWHGPSLFLYVCTKEKSVSFPWHSWGPPVEPPIDGEWESSSFGNWYLIIIQCQPWYDPERPFCTRTMPPFPPCSASSMCARRMERSEGRRCGSLVTTLGLSLSTMFSWLMSLTVLQIGLRISKRLLRILLLRGVLQ